MRMDTARTQSAGFPALRDWRDVCGYGVMMARGREWRRMLEMGLRFGGNPPRRIERNVLDPYSESFVGLV